ncbi:hypothetical protein [Sodalis glossinidius]|nr:hypothetical protein [Sodalis glossinidius]
MKILAGGYSLPLRHLPHLTIFVDGNDLISGIFQPDGGFVE